ncbi:hypothetical protein [Paludibaculum fermentans]|uniref:hypothetical protein n=1 Tax=Paludibaculum fermentans TaxID=1473598 RepID=UPI003EB6DAAD
MEKFTMHVKRIASIAALSVLLGTCVPVMAGQGQEKEKEKQGKGEKREGKPQQAEPRGQQQRGGPPAQQERARPQSREQQHQPQAQQSPRPQAGPPQQQHRAQDEQRQRQQREQSRPQPQQQAPRRQEQRSYQAPPQRSRQDAMSWQQKRGWVRPGAWQGQRDWQQSRARHWETEHREWRQRGGYGGYFIPADRYSLQFGPQHYFRIRSRPVMYMGFPRFEYGGFSFMMVDPWPEYWAENWYDQDDVYVEYDDGYYLYNRQYPRVRLAITVVL